MICSKHNLKIKLFHQFSICLQNCCSFRSLSSSSNPVCVKMPSKFVVFIGVTPDTVDTCIQTNTILWQSSSTKLFNPNLDRENGRSPQVVFTPSSLKPILMQKPQALTFPQNRSNSFELFSSRTQSARINFCYTCSNFSPSFVSLQLPNPVQCCQRLSDRIPL